MWPLSSVALVWNAPAPPSPHALSSSANPPLGSERPSQELGERDRHRDEDSVPKRARDFADEIWRITGAGGGGGEEGGSDQGERETSASSPNLMSSSPPLIHSVWVNFNDSNGNDIVGETWAHVLGRETREALFIM